MKTEPSTTIRLAFTILTPGLAYAARDPVENGPFSCPCLRWSYGSLRSASQKESVADIFTTSRLGICAVVTVFLSMAHYRPLVSQLHHYTPENFRTGYTLIALRDILELLVVRYRLMTRGPRTVREEVEREDNFPGSHLQDPQRGFRQGSPTLHGDALPFTCLYINRVK